MNRNHFWKFIFVLFLIVWSITEIYPPGPRNLIDQFNETATLGRDTALDAIVKKARELDAKAPHSNYRNLLEAIGTNNIARYFPTNYIKITASRNPTVAILNRLQREAAGEVKLGLDLQGGAEFQLRMDFSQLDTNNTYSALQRRDMINHGVEVLRKRVDRFGVAEPLILPAGEDRILVQLPGIPEEQLQDAQVTMQKAAVLSFHMVDEEMETHLAQGIVPPGHVKARWRRLNRMTGEEFYSDVIIRRSPEKGFKGEFITHAMASHNPMTGEPEIHFNLNSEGGRIFGEITERNVGKSFATKLDDEVISVASITEPIRGGSGRISGGFTDKEALDLANSMQNPLKAPLKVESASTVDASLGEDTISSGIRASIYGTIAVALFMLVYYLTAGAVANVAMVLNILVLLGVMCSIDITLTLPGIAGIVLTVGMAVDANVLIYERIREEMESGKSVRGALHAGYSKAFGTILDSNLTTLISSVLLIILGTGTIRGFGTALTIGLIVSMFTALVVTRLIFDFLLAKGILKSLPMLRIVRGGGIDFIRFTKPAFILSWSLIIVGCLYGISRGNNMLSIDFAGGDELLLSFKPEARASISVDKVRESLADLKVGEPLIQFKKDRTKNQESLRVVVPSMTADKTEAALKAKFPNAGFERRQVQQIGAAIGFEIQKSAVIATLLSLFGILIYVAFRYEFSFAVAAVIAVIHDILMTTGLYCLTGLTGEGRQFNATFVAAILTIIGFSINDTIVIFDRIREDLKLGVRGSFRDLMNHALNQTLSRTIITSGTVFLATLSLYVFGGAAINDFAFTFLAGILTGTYSSIYIAGALVLWWHKGQRPALGGNAVRPSEISEIEAIDPSPSAS